jgi:malonyl-CoA/methylmalonyl-CoA synthetase
VPEDIPARASSDPGAWVVMAAQSHPQRTFLTTPAGRTVSYAELAALTARYANALTQRGVVSGERVVVRVEKSVEAVLLYLACLRLGAVFVPVNAAGTPAEFEHLVGDAQPCLVVLAPADLAVLEPIARSAGTAAVVTLGAQGEGSLPQLALNCPAALTPAPVHAPQHLAAIVYTSGTTGRPKGAMLTRANLGSNATALVGAWRFAGDDVLLHVLPLFHVHGLFVAINTVLASASSMLFLAKFDGDTAISLLPRVTVFMGVPTHYTRLLQDARLNRESTARMRLFVSGSAPLLAETHQEFSRRTGHGILERYGMTETLMNTSNPYDGPRVPGSVGPPLPGIEVRVTDPASGAAVEAGSIGALQIRGPNVFAGYWRDPAKTRSEFTADGWFRTGDLGNIDAAGYVTIVGRAKDVVISGGFNVYPKEVESELDSLPGVAESAVFGVLHPDLGEGVTAAIVLRPGAALTESAIIGHVRTRLSAYKVPRRVLLLPELPRNAMGKVRKEALRTTYAALYTSR